MGKASRSHERFIRAIVANAIGECSSCHHSYDVDSVSVLGHQDALWFFGLQCEHCQSQGLVAAQIVDETGARVSPSSEANAVAADAAKVETPQQSSPVDGHDLREMREFLAEFDGDFKALFGRRDDHRSS